MSVPMDRRYTLDYPELGTGPVPIEPYISPEYFDKEREHIFRQAWLHLGRIEEIPNVGDYVVRRIDAAPASIVVTRSSDGRIRSFHNVCIHRGNKLVWDECGNARRFTCKYHGWTYLNNGQLMGVSEEDMFFNLDKKNLHLAELPTEVWNGFIFVNLSSEPAESFQESIQDVDELTKGFPFDAFPVCYCYRAHLRANWKVLVDSQQEGYHAKTLHRRSLPGFLTNREAPSRHVVDIRLFKRNRLISYFGNREFKPTPSAMLAFKYGPSVANFASGETPPGMNPAKDPSWAFDEYAIFPNMQLLLFANMYITHTMWPISVNEAIWEGRGYLPAAKTMEQRFNLEHSKVLLRDAWLEDGSTLEATQMGLESGAITHQILQDQEVLIRHSSKVIDDMINTG